MHLVRISRWTILTTTCSEGRMAKKWKTIRSETGDKNRTQTPSEIFTQKKECKTVFFFKKTKTSSFDLFPRFPLEGRPSGTGCRGWSKVDCTWKGMNEIVIFYAKDANRQFVFLTRDTKNLVKFKDIEKKSKNWFKIWKQDSASHLTEAWLMLISPSLTASSASLSTLWFHCEDSFPLSSIPSRRHFP